MYLRVVTWLLKDCHGNGTELIDVNHWLGIRLVCLRVVTLLQKDHHDNAIEVTVLE